MTTFDKKTINAEVNKISSISTGTKFFVTGVPLLDGSGETNIPNDILLQVAKPVSEKHPTTTLFIITAGSTQCQAIVYIPSDVVINPQEWIERCGMLFENTHDGFSFATLECEYPLKMKDEINARAFNYLRTNGLYVDESDDELPEFDWGIC